MRCMMAETMLMNMNMKFNRKLNLKPEKRILTSWKVKKNLEAWESKRRSVQTQKGKKWLPKVFVACIFCRCIGLWWTHLCKLAVEKKMSTMRMRESYLNSNSFVAVPVSYASILHAAFSQPVNSNHFDSVFWSRHTQHTFICRMHMHTVQFHSFIIVTFVWISDAEIPMQPPFAPHFSLSMHFVSSRICI